MASVSFSGVRKSYAAHPVIKGVTLDIADGEFVVLVGPSGCGKSTLLRMVAGLESITGGEIAIGSNVVNDVMPKDRDIAMVFQTYALYPHMTVAENMGFSLRLAGVTKTEIDQRVKKAAGILALEPLLDRLPKQLSGGQRQRVAMGRAIVRDPKVFLFDEPLSNLDAKLRVKMRAEVKELHQRLRTTTIYVTHDQIEAMTMADRVVVMRDGIVEQVGTPLELYDRPASLFVASFIGSPAMNFLNGRIDEDESGISFQADNGFRLQVLPRRTDATVGETIFGIRPEHLELTDPAAPGAIRAKIVVVEPTGAETVVIARAGGDEITAVVRGRSAVRPGEDIGLRPMPEHVHFFLGDGSGSAPR